MRGKLIAAGVGLFGYGAFLGWAVTGDFFERRMKSNQKLLGEIIDRKTAEVEEARRLLIKNSPAKAEMPNGDDTEDEALSEEDFSEEGTEEVRSNLQGLIDRYTSDPDSVEELNDVTVRTIELDNTPPFVISREKYAWDADEGDEYDKNTLTYYPRERILLDDDNELIDDKEVNSVVGWKNLNRFGDESGDADVVFIRNRRLLTDFEVVRELENQPPAHILYGMSHDEFETGRASGLIRFRSGD